MTVTALPALPMDWSDLWGEALAAHPYGTMVVPVGLLRDLCARADAAPDPDELAELRREADCAGDLADDLHDRDTKIARLRSALDDARDAVDCLRPLVPDQVEASEPLDRLDRALSGR